MGMKFLIVSFDEVYVFIVSKLFSIHSKDVLIFSFFI